MNVQPDLHMDKAAFLAWHRQNEGRYELAGGRIAMMAGISRTHIRIVRNLVAVLEGRLDPGRWEVLAEMGLDVGPKTVRYPDVVVDRAGGAGSDYTATAPVLLAEVLSPSTAAVDLGDKAAEYLRLPSILAYVVVSQDESKAWVWVRSGTAFASGPEIVTGIDATIRIGPLGLDLPLAEIYAGIQPN